MLEFLSRMRAQVTRIIQWDVKAQSSKKRLSLFVGSRWTRASGGQRSTAQVPLRLRPRGREGNSLPWTTASGVTVVFSNSEGPQASGGVFAGVDERARHQE